MSDPKPDDTGSQARQAVETVGRFSREFVATLLAVVTTALGVVIALAWNTALTKLFGQVFGPRGQVAALFVYAAAITAIGVFAIVSLGRVASRLDAEPVEFKYPVKAKESD